MQHVILSAQIGTRHMQKRIVTYNKVYTEMSNQVAAIIMTRYAMIASDLHVFITYRILMEDL